MSCASYCLYIKHTVHIKRIIETVYLSTCSRLFVGGGVWVGWGGVGVGVCFIQ